MEVLTVGEYKALLKETAKKKSARGRSSSGTREDIGFFVRSKWEANYVRLLRYLGQRFEYEKYEFKFPVERGTMFYLPDFYLPDKDMFVELKGHMDQKSRTQLSRFLQYYPDKAKHMRIMIRKVFDSKAKLTKEAAMLVKIGFRMDQILEYAASEQLFNNLANWEN